MPRLSVLMPAFNAEATVLAAVRSTLRDLPGDSELVVLDDGSTDTTAALVAGVDDRRLRLLERANDGVASGLNLLLQRSDSEYIARMDADDLVIPGRFRRQLSAIARGADAVFTTVMPYGSGKVALPRLSGIAPEDFALHLLLTNPVAHSTLMATRHSIERVNGYRLIPTEDYDLWLRMAAAGSRLQRLALPGLMYRHHPGQVTASPEWRRSSWENPEIAQAFAALSSQELGPAFTRITTLSIAEDLSAEERTARFDEFSGAFETALTGHSEAARRALSRKLTERRRWLHQRVTSAAPSQAARHRNQDNVPHKLPAGPDATGPRLAGPASTGSSPRERYLVAVAADRRANAAYPKSRLVLRWFRSAQRWRQTPGRLGRAMFMVIGGSYKVATEGLLGMELPVSTSVGPGLRLRHGFGIVVNPASRIGEGVMLRHGVTLGNRKTTDDCPVIEDGVEIGVGAVVIGAVTVGRGAKLGPNVVVARDVPAGACVLSPLSDTVLLRGKTTWASKGQAGSAA